MQEIEFGRLVYLLVLVVAVGGWFFAQNRNSLNKTMQHAAVWGLIFVGAVAVAGLWDDIQRSSSGARPDFIGNNQVVIPQGRDGHYYLTLAINDQPVRFVVDTGASEVVLSQEDAARIGLPLDELNYIGRAMTANGEVSTAPVWLEQVKLGQIIDRDVPAQVNGGPMDGSLLGMTYLQRFSHIGIQQGEMVLTR